MRVDIGFMFESNGNWFCNVAIANDHCKNFLDTDNYVEFGYGQNVRSAIDRAAKSRMVLGTGQTLLDPEECSLLISHKVMSKEEINAIYEQVGIMYKGFKNESIPNKSTNRREIRMIKDTLKLQMASLIDFANVLGFYLTQNGRGHKFFEDDRGFKVSMTRMIEYHNGNLKYCRVFHTLHDVARSLSNILRTELTVNQVEAAYNSRRCYTFKYRYNKKTTKFIGSQYDNIVKLLPNVTL